VANPTGYSNAEVKAGVFLTMCLALFVASLFIYGKAARYLRGRQDITVLFTSVTSLRQDAPVRLNGFEIGRVKSISIVHLKPEITDRLPQLQKKDLDNLPLSDDERRQLAKLDDTLPGALKDVLKDRTMIELVLEVVSEGDTQRFRDDDQVRISTTLMGDTAVEISSGSSRDALAANRLLLGYSGDFYSNVAKSVEQIKELLGSVSDVVGPGERDAVRKALRRLDTITERLEKISVFAGDRLPKTWDKLDEVADTAKGAIKRIDDTVATVQPQVSRALTTADTAVKDLQGRVGSLADESKTAVVELKDRVKPLLTDLQQITSRSKDDLPVLVKNARELAARLQGTADKLDAVLGGGDRLLKESYPDLRRMILALRMSAENLEEGSNLLKRKPWLIYREAPENSSQEAARKTAHDLEVATKGFADLSFELKALRRNLGQGPQDHKEQLERIEDIMGRLDTLTDVLRFAGDAAKKDVLPPFERKSGMYNPVPDDPEVNRKPTWAQ
jgi:ABC-type transporter Mla subunit MlaD